MNRSRSRVASDAYELKLCPNSRQMTRRQASPHAAWGASLLVWALPGLIARPTANSNSSNGMGFWKNATAPLASALLFKLAGSPDVIMMIGVLDTS